MTTADCRDADTIVYVFGTFHALDGKSNWFDGRVRDAFESSNELVLETIIPNSPGENAPIRLPPGARTVTPSASFLASTRMAINAGKSQGMQVAKGADMVLRDEAKLESKPVEGLETLESQLTMFTRLPDGGNSGAVAPKAGQPIDPAANAGLPKVMTEMQSAWKRGDQKIFVAMLTQLKQVSPVTYRMMFAERNARWADWIHGRLQTPGTVFVAVGAGHLAGQDSLLVRLAELGIPSARVN